MKKSLILILSILSLNASAVDFANYSCTVSKYADGGSPFGEEFVLKRDTTSNYNTMSAVVDSIEFKVSLVDKASGPQANFFTNYTEQGIKVSSQQDFNGVQIIFGPTHQVENTGYIITCDTTPNW